MNAVGLVEPLAFRFETGCIRHDRPASRARGRGRANTNNHDQPKLANIASNHTAQQQPHRQPGSAAVVDAGRHREKVAVGGGTLLLVRVHAARRRHMKAFLPSAPFCSPLNGCLQSIGKDYFYYAPR